MLSKAISPSKKTFKESEQKKAWENASYVTLENA